MTVKTLFIILPFFYLFFLLLRVDPSLNVDLGRHLAMGEIISQCRCVPEVNMFSFTSPEFKAVNHSWLSEFIFFQIANIFGFTGLLFLKWAIVISVFATIYLLSFRKEAVGMSVLFSLLTLALFVPRFMVRPELFSYLFIALFLLLFARYKRTKTVWLLWGIPLLLIVWVNMHIYFFIGVLLYFIFVLDLFVVQKKMNKNILLITVCVIFSPLVNPAFIEGAIYPLLVFHNYGAPIIENYPAARLLTFYNPLSPQFFGIIVFELFSCFALAGMLLYPRKKLVVIKMNALMGIVLGQLLMRCVALFALLGLPLLLEEYVFLRENVAKRVRKKFIISFTILVSIIVIMMFGLQVRSTLISHQFGFTFSHSYKAAVDFMIDNKLQGNIFHNPALGNYLIYRLYPNKHIFLDGRPEAYPEELFDKYFTMLQDNTYFNQQAHVYNMHVIVYSPIEYPEQSQKFLSQLLNDKKWEPVFWDGNAAVFVQNSATNKKLISEKREVKRVLLQQLN